MAKRQTQGRSEGGRNRNTVSRRGTTSGTGGRGSGGGRGSTRTAGGRTRTGGGGTTKAAGGTKSRGGSRTAGKVGTRATGGGKRAASAGSQTAGRRPTGAAGNRGQKSGSRSGRTTSARTNQESTRQERMTSRGATKTGGRSRTSKQEDQTRTGRMDENRNETGTQFDQNTGEQESYEDEELYQRTTDYKQDVRKESDVFAQTVQKSNLWLKQVMAELGTDDKQRAHTALKSVLQALRDRLTIEEATDLAAQMPTLIRGMFFEGWKPADKPIKYNREEFTDRIREQFRNLSGINHAEIIRAVFRVLQQNIPEGEINHIIGTMPEEFAEFWMQDELVG